MMSRLAVALHIRVPPCCAVGCFISRSVSVTGEAGSRQRVSAAHSHGPALPISAGKASNYRVLRHQYFQVQHTADVILTIHIFDRILHYIQYLYECNNNNNNIHICTCQCSIQLNNKLTRTSVYK